MHRRGLCVTYINLNFILAHRCYIPKRNKTTGSNLDLASRPSHSVRPWRGCWSSDLCAKAAAADGRGKVLFPPPHATVKPTSTHTHTHARAHAHAHTHTHTPPGLLRERRHKLLTFMRKTGFTHTDTRVLKLIICLSLYQYHNND